MTTFEAGDVGGRGAVPRFAKPYQTKRNPEFLDGDANSLILAQRWSMCLGKASSPSFHLGDLFGDRSTRLLT